MMDLVRAKPMSGVIVDTPLGLRLVDLAGNPRGIPSIYRDTTDEHLDTYPIAAHLPPILKAVERRPDPEPVATSAPSPCGDSTVHAYIPPKQDYVVCWKDGPFDKVAVAIGAIEPDAIAQAAQRYTEARLWMAAPANRQVMAEHPEWTWLDVAEHLHPWTDAAGRAVLK